MRRLPLSVFLSLRLFYYQFTLVDAEGGLDHRRGVIQDKSNKVEYENEDNL